MMVKDFEKGVLEGWLQVKQKDGEKGNQDLNGTEWGCVWMRGVTGWRSA